jgi:hypothetical protein
MLCNCFVPLNVQSTQVFIHVASRKCRMVLRPNESKYSPRPRRIDENRNPVIRPGLSEPDRCCRPIDAVRPVECRCCKPPWKVCRGRRRSPRTNRSISIVFIDQLVKSKTMLRLRSISITFSNSAYATTVTVCARCDAELESPVERFLVASD